MTDRRAFLRAVSAAPLLPVLGQTAAAPPQPSPAPSPSASPSDAPGPLALALAEAARVRFAAHLRPGDVEEIRKVVQGNLQAAERLRAVKLTNADEPVTQFAATRPAKSKRGVWGGRIPPPSRATPDSLRRSGR
jgi:hypothetical protein